MARSSAIDWLSAVPGIRRANRRRSLACCPSNTQIQEGWSVSHARHPTPYEAAALQLPPTAILIIRATTTHAINSAPIDYTVSAWPADTTAITADNHPTT